MERVVRLEVERKDPLEYIIKKSHITDTLSSEDP